MKLLAAFLLYPVAVIIGIIVLMFGWGLEPKSWAWIIGGAFFQFVFMVIATALEKSK